MRSIHARRSGRHRPGISVADHERIFLEFEQARIGETKSKPEGTGLGLALAKKLVEMHGGKIWVESEVGEKAAASISACHAIRTQAEIQKRSRSI